MSKFDLYICEAVDKATVAVKNFKAGCLRDHIEFWKNLTSDPHILGILEGVKLEFSEPPIQNEIPKPYHFDHVKMKKIEEQVHIMLSKGIVEPVGHSKGEFISNIFTRDKKEGGVRIILDLTEMNKFIQYHHFKMDTFQTALDLIYPNCFMASIDWKDAYFSVPINSDDRKYLRFFWKNQLYQFTCLPNGLASAPRIFTKITKVFFASLRKMGFLCSSYIDDAILVGDETGCERNVMTNLKLSDKAGWVVHPTKSRLKPSQVRTHLGFVINSVSMKVKLTEERAEKFFHTVSNILNCGGDISIRQLAEAVGLMVASFPAVEFGKLYYRRCDNFKTLALRQHMGNYNAMVHLPNVCMSDLHWWEENIRNTSAPIRRMAPDITLTSDASTKGWGGTYGDQKTGGHWSGNEQIRHINELELTAALFTIKTFCSKMTNKHILIKVDNTTCVVYINLMGGRKEGCNHIARQIWEWCRLRNNFVTATYLPGALNIEADHQSRIFHDNGEWELEDDIFKALARFWGNPVIDLFASRINRKVSSYCAWKPDPECVAVDAFSIAWNAGLCYAFPPFCLLGATLQKIAMEASSAIIIFPLWPTQHWYSVLASLLIDFPILLFNRSKRLPVIHHPSLNATDHLPKMRLAAALISGEHHRLQSFQKRLKLLSKHHGERGPDNSTLVTLGSGVHFVRQGIEIPFKNLWN